MFCQVHIFFFFQIFLVTNHNDKITGAGTVIADHDIPKEFIKEIEETTDWTFNEEPNL